MLIDKYYVYDNIIFVDDGNIILSSNTLFNDCTSVKDSTNTVIYTEAAIIDILNAYNNDILTARVNTALLISTLRARCCLYISKTAKADIESKLRIKYDKILNKMLAISDSYNNTVIKKPGAIKELSNFVGYSKCTQLKRLVLATKNNFDNPEYSKLCTLLYNSTYKMLSYGFSYGVKMRRYEVEGNDIKLPFAFAIYNDIDDRLFLDNNHYLITFEFIGLLCGGVDKVFSENALNQSDFDVSSEVVGDTRSSKIKKIKDLRKMVDTVNPELVDQENYMKELEGIILKLEKLGYYVYEFDRHSLSLTVSIDKDSNAAIQEIHEVLNDSFIEKAISRTHVIKDNKRRYWYIKY